MSYDFVEDIQRGILHLSLKDKSFFTEVMNLIKPEYFDYSPHSKMYESIVEFYSEYRKLPTPPVLMEEVKSKINERENFSDYMEEINSISSMDSSEIVDEQYYMGLVEKFAKESSMKEAIKSSIGLIEEGRASEVEHVVKEALMVGRDIDHGQIYFKDVKNRWIREISQKEQERFPTIFPVCNAHLEGGNSRGELCVAVAPPGVGKSIFLVNQSVKTLISNKKVLFVTLEMSQDKVAKRFDSIMTHIPYNSLVKPQSQTELNERHKIFKAKFPNAELVIKEFPTGTVNANSIRQLLNQLALHQDFIPDMIAVDYLELMLPIRKTDQEHTAQMRIAEELRAIGQEHNVLMWTVTQTNRDGESVELITKREMGGSYDKIKPVDWAVSLNQTSEEYDSGEMRAYVLKARDAKQKYIVPMNIDYRTLIMEASNGNTQEED